VNLFYYPKSPSFELYGCDFILTEDLKLWFIECNSGPMMESTTEEREKILAKMMKDHFELMFGYLRSRMKRVISFINKLSKEIPSESIFPDRVILDDYAKTKLEFDAVNKKTGSSLSMKLGLIMDGQRYWIII